MSAACAFPTGVRLTEKKIVPGDSRPTARLNGCPWQAGKKT